MLSGILTTDSTLTNVIPDVSIHTRPVERLTCKSNAAVHDHVSTVGLLEHLSSHTPWYNHCIESVAKSINALEFMSELSYGQLISKL